MKITLGAIVFAAWKTYFISDLGFSPLGAGESIGREIEQRASGFGGAQTREVRLAARR
jgi:hypothetical protein